MTVKLQPVQDANFLANVFSHSLAVNAAREVGKEKSPIRYNKVGDVQFRTTSGMWLNSALRKREWEELDAAVIEAAGPRTGRISSLPQVQLGGIGTLISQWNVASQMTEANVNITGRSSGDQDRVDYNVAGVPVPVVWKDFEIGGRKLAASRRLGNGLDVTTAYEASRVVSEKLTDMLYNGASSVVLNSNSIYGLTTHTNRNTGSAAGDFGTITNIYSTVLAMISAAAADNYHGPFDLDVATTQYIEMLEVYPDGSGQTALDRVKSLPQINNVYSSDQLAAGSLTLTQKTRNVVDWASAMSITLVEWMSGDGLTHHFKVMAIAAPRVKADYNSQSGVVHYTGA